jgi:co-chaperonin GroES (HSP10)
MKITPLFDNVLIESVETSEKTTKSGIVLPENAEKKEQSRGVVSAIGPGKFAKDGSARLPMSVKVGDTVIFTKPWSDDKKMEFDGKKYFLVSEEEIIAITE